ncbi:MAG TPA: TonB-dependent receptor [Terriglobia bacterium]|nr:TonB-dependent receptor [Terriglobia bacterium]
MRKLLRNLAILLILLALPAAALAQGQLGALTGLVTDPTRAAVPGALITVTNIATGISSTAKTSDAGYYRVPVLPGTYRVEAEKAGFKAEVLDQVVVPVEQVVTLDVSLQVGSQTQTVEVTGAAPLITPSTAEVGVSISPNEFQTLPIPLDDGGRQPESFIFRSLPGAVGDPYQGSINGGQQFSHQILIDGVTIGRYDMSGGSMDEYSPGTDAIGEFKVQTSNYSAEYGDTGGAIVNFSMKSGTNQFHGTAFEYNKNPMFNAAGLLANAFGTPKDNEKENNFGGTIGGPIRKDKVFFFGSYEGDRFTDFAYSGTTTIPTAAMRQGDFSSFLGARVGTDALGRPVYTNEIYDPTTSRTVAAGAKDPVTGLVNNSGSDAVLRDPFPGNMIPAAEFSKAAAALLPLFPDPLFSGNIRNTPEFCCSTPVLDRNAYNVKFDEAIGSKQRLTEMFGYYRRVLWKRNTTNSAYPPFPGQPISTFKNQDVVGPQARLTHSWTVNDHSVNLATLAYNRTNNANNLTNNAKYTSQLGIPGIPDLCFPRTSFSTGSNTHIQFMSALGVACANIDPSESYIAQDTFSTTRGRHSVKFGGDFTRYRYDTNEPGAESGSFSFNSKETSLAGFSSTTGHPFASWLLGAADAANRSVYTTEPGYRAGVLAVFVQDDWRATSKLTLNIGLRWELPLPKTEAFNRQSGFDPMAPNPGADNIPGALVFLGNCTGCLNRTSFQDWYFKEFGPRFGIAYAATKNLVLRGGYGIAYGPPILNNFGSQSIFGYNSSVVVHRSGTPSNIDPVTFLSPLASASLPAWAKVGIPPFTGTLPNLDPSSANGNGLDFLPRTSLAQPYVQNWSAGFQYQLPHQIVLEANYVGSKGTRLLDSNFATDFNQINSRFLPLGDNLDMDFQTALNAGILQPYGITQVPYPDFESNNWDTSVGAGLSRYPQYTGLTNNYPTMGSSSYHALQATARKNSTKGLTFIAAYTFSKTIDDTDTALYYPSYAVQDFYNRKLEKSIASFDHPQSLKLTWIYSLPIGRGQKWLTSAGAWDRLFSGWQVTAIQQYLSGDPLYVSSSLNTTLNESGITLLPGIHADVVAGVPQGMSPGRLNVVLATDPNTGAITNGTGWVNPAAFANPPASPNGNYPLRIGTGPRFLPQTRGPFHSNEDFGIIKNTRLNERFTAQVRCDMFNVFNRTGLGNPDTNLADGLPSQGGTFGLITAPDNGPRVVQFALRVNF